MILEKFIQDWFGFLGFQVRRSLFWHFYNGWKVVGSIIVKLDPLPWTVKQDTVTGARMCADGRYGVTIA